MCYYEIVSISTSFLYELPWKYTKVRKIFFTRDKIYDKNANQNKHQSNTNVEKII
jgi:hypothetical protein